MLHNAADHATELTPAALETAYTEQLSSTISSAGIDTVVSETGLDADVIAAVANGDTAELAVTDAAAILAVSKETPDADAIVFELRDHILLGMTTAVLDVDTIAANVDLDLTGQEIQQAIEGRTEMKVAQLAAIQALIEGRMEQ